MVVSSLSLGGERGTRRARSLRPGLVTRGRARGAPEAEQGGDAAELVLGGLTGTLDGGARERGDLGTVLGEHRLRAFVEPHHGRSMP
jgi:hypothetical protein